MPETKEIMNTLPPSFKRWLDFYKDVIRHLNQHDPQGLNDDQLTISYKDRLNDEVIYKTTKSFIKSMCFDELAIEILELRNCLINESEAALTQHLGRFLSRNQSLI